jgi:hypothetical protein
MLPIEGDEMGPLRISLRLTKRQADLETTLRKPLDLESADDVGRPNREFWHQ